MAEEEQALQALRDLSEAFRKLNDTVITASDRQKKYTDDLAKNDRELNEYARSLRAAAKTTKDTAEAERLIAERKKAYETDAVRRAQSYAREQIQAERETRTFASRLATAAGTSIQSQKALLVWTDRLKGAGESLSAIGGGLVSFTRGLAEGASKFNALNPLIDGMTKAFESIPILGTATKLAAEGTKFMLTQLQTATDAFQEISRAGGAGAEGMTGIMRQFQTSGMTLEGFKKTVTANSQALAMLGGTVSKGAEAFSRMSQSIVDSEVGDYLRRLGMTADEIGESTAQLLIIQQRSGFAQGRTMQQLTKASADYLRELDAVTKLTGMSREEAKKQLDAQMREARFLSTMRIMEREGRGDQAKQLELLSLSMAGVNDELSQAIRDASSGILDSEVVQRFARAGVDVVGAVDRIKRGGADAEAGFRDLQEQVKRVLPGLESQAQVLNPQNNPFPELYKLVDLTNIEFDKARAKTEQNTTQTDKLTGAAADAQKSLEQMSRQISALATTILPRFATVVSDITKFLNEQLQKFGVPGIVGPQAAPAAAAGAAAGAKPTDMATLASKIIKAEGGAITARNPFSSASGLGQITRGRYEDLVKQAPVGSRLRGTTFEQYQQDEGLQREALNAQIENLRGYLASKQLSTSDAAVYLAHVFGPAGARQVLSHSDSTPVNRLFDEGIITKNPAIFRGVTTVGDLKRVVGEKMGSGFEDGGIARGPKSGYATLLHGTEAVVPLPDGEKIPVQISIKEMASKMGGFNMDFGGFKFGGGAPDVTNAITQSLQQLTAEGSPLETALKQIAGDYSRAMTAAIERFQMQQSGSTMPAEMLGELVNLMRESNSTQARILQVSQN